ncbi:MAG: transcriptional regulator PpsR, partial [Rhizobiales bacterium]|nr:transcriptional regulator PpsR [Rhizobacter sp.]
MNREAGDHPDLAALSAWAPELARTFVSLASDIALVIDETGVIRNVAQGGGDPIAPAAYQWVGQPWIDTVSGETRPKIENLLREVAATGIARRREVNHPLGADSSIPVAYTAIRLGTNGPVLAVGRDLRAIAAIQKRYVESQQDMERGYWQARQAEARYQLLFQVATDAVIVLDGETLEIVEANHAAARLFGTGTEQLKGRHASAAFEHHSRGAVNELLGNARATGQSGEIRARLQGTQTGTSVVATPFRADDAMRLLVRMRTLDPAATSAALNQTLSRLVDGARDGVVVTDSSGRILIANPAFLALAHLSGEAQVKGKPLMNWLGLADQPLAALVAKVRRDGIARHIQSWVKRGASAAVQIEISAALLTEGDQECIGFTIHPVARSGSSPATPRAFDDAGADALTRVLRAGIESLGAQLGD